MNFIPAGFPPGTPMDCRQAQRGRASGLCWFLTSVGQNTREIFLLFIGQRGEWREALRGNSPGAHPRGFQPCNSMGEIQGLGQDQLQSR